MSRSNTRTRTGTASRPITGRSRPKTAATSTSYGYFANDILCAISESRGISPSVGLAFVNLSTCEAVLCQFADTQTFARTCHKLKVFGPTEIIFASTAADSKLLSIVRENLEVEKNNVLMTGIDRRYWSETLGHDYIRRLALPNDLEALKLSLAGNYFAVCCFAAVLRFVDLGLSQTFAAQSLRIKFESSEGAMMIDLWTIANLELVQNLQNAKSKHCLFGLLNETSTRMGARLLKNNVLQPSTDRAKIEKRWAAVNELSTKEELFFGLREELKQMVDTDRALANLVLLPKKLDFQYMEQSVNNVLMLKSFIDSIKPIWQDLAGACSEELQNIKELCDPGNYAEVQELIEYALSPDVSYSQNPTDLRNHRVFAIRAGTNGFLDVARQSYNEFIGDARELIEQLQEQHEIPLGLKYDTARQFYIRIKANELESGTDLPDVFVNVFRKGKIIECQTLDLIKYNQKIKDAHNEIIAMSDSSVQELIAAVRTNIHPLFKISEGLALLDLLASFAHLATTLSYVRPDVSAEALAIKSGRHPIREKIQKEKYVPNDVYATQHHKRFQVITGCNMSGKSTYIRSIALMIIMAQIGSFVPAEYASFPITCQLFARVATDDCIEANVSTFASEMREMAFILRNIEPQSLVIVDELGRGTSTTDGLAIAIAISEALIQSRIYVWFVTHFRDLPRILAERVGVYSMHMGVDIDPDFSRMRMRYRMSEGREEQKFYGLALAQIIDLPEQVMDMAVAASKELNARNDTKQGSLKPLAIAKRRKLVVRMRETITQAKHGELENNELFVRMQSLQREFLVRMAAIDAEVAAIETPPALSPQAEGARESTPELESDTVNSDQARYEDHHVQNEESSWDASVNHENPLFRPMPTTLEVKETSISRIPQFVKNGNSLDDPICIEDDTSTTSGS